MNLAKKIVIQRGTAETLTAQLIRQLEELILNGEFSANPRLPSAMQISKQVNLSYCTIEAVLKELVRRDYIERNPRGSFVKKRYTKTTARNILVVFYTYNERDSLYKRKIMEGLGDIFTPPDFNLTVMVEEELKKQGLEWWTEAGCSGKYAGIILDKEGTRDADTLKLLRTSEIPCVLFNSGVQSLFDGALRICPDFSKAFTQLTQYLCGLGHQRIALITRTHDSFSNYTFRTVWQETLKAYEIIPDDNYLIENVSNDPSKIREAALQLLQLPDAPDAIMCGDDIIAYHVVNTLKEHEIRVPDDISVTGFSGFDIAEIMEPRLTTVKINLQRMGRIIGEKMLGLLRGKSEKGVIYIEHDLVTGKSTGAFQKTHSIKHKKEGVA